MANENQEAPFGAIWTGRAVLDGEEQPVAVVKVDDRHRPMFFGYGRWRYPAPETGYEILAAWALDHLRPRAWKQLSALRAAGWTVAVHNDYRMGGTRHTFWLFTKDGRAIKGEGRTDGEALAHCTLAAGDVQEATPEPLSASTPP